jgi:large subunit ribosomal protein L10
VPSNKVLEAKKQVVIELTEQLKEATTGVFVDYSGINVADDTKLRKELREAGVKYSVVKNTLTRFAAKEAGIEGLDDILNGTTALAVSDDHVTAAKIIGEFAEKNENFKIKGGIMEGKAISVEEVVKLSKMPNREQLLCMLLYALNGNISGLARALQAVADQKNEATPA